MGIREYDTDLVLREYDISLPWIAGEVDSIKAISDRTSPMIVPILHLILVLMQGGEVVVDSRPVI